MRKVRSIRVASLGLVFPLLLAGCGGDDPDPSPTTSATPAATTKAPPPVATNTPDPHFSPLGGKPATEAEKKYDRAQKVAQDTQHSKKYEEAIPLFNELVKERPDDAENYFYLMLSHGWLEGRPTKDSEAYKNAKKVLELTPTGKHAKRATRYCIAAEFVEPGDDFKYKINTRTAQEKFEHYPDETYKLAAETPLHADLKPALDKDGKATLWEAEISPGHYPKLEKLPKGLMVKVLGEQAYFYSLNSWRKPVRRAPSKYNDKMFDVAVFYIEVVAEGEHKGKKGWVVHHMDRWIDRLGEDPWAEWISNRVDLSKPYKGGEAVIPADQIKASPTPSETAKPKPKPKPTKAPPPPEDPEDGLPD